MRYNVHLVDPFTLKARGTYDDVTDGGSIAWDAGNDVVVSGSLNFFGDLPDRGSMLRVVAINDDGGEAPIVTGFWQTNDDVIVGGHHRGTLSILSPLVALTGAVTPTTYTIGRNARSQQVIADICGMALRPVTTDTTLGDYRYAEPVTYAAGTGLMKIAGEAASLAGLSIMVDASGYVTITDTAHAPLWEWTDLPGFTPLVSVIDKASTRFDSPNRVITTLSASGEETRSASVEERWTETAPAHLGRFVDRVVAMTSGTGRASSLLAAARTELDATKVTEEWTLHLMSATEVRPRDRVRITSYEDEGIRRLDGHVSRVDIALDGLASTTITTRGTAS